jgi:O-antigen/teichoic acid export membrane protein
LYLQYIDERLYGAWLASGSVIALLGLSDFGFSSVIIQKIANLFGKKDMQNLGKMLGTNLVISPILSSIPIIITFFIYSHVAGWVKIEGEEAVQISNAFWLASISTSIMLINYIVGGFFLGIQKTTIPSTMLIATSVIGIIASLVFLTRMDLGLISIPLGYITGSLILAIGQIGYLWLWISKNLPPKSLRFELSYFKDLLGQSSWVFIDRLSKTASMQSDKLIVAVMIDPLYTTMLVFSKKASDLLNTIVMNISAALMPGLAHLAAEGDNKKLRKYMINSIKTTFIVGMYGAGGIFLLNKSFVSLWVGDEFFAGTLFTTLIIISGLFYVLNAAVYNNLFANGKISIVSKASMLESLATIPLSIAFCYFGGINGIVLAAILAVLPTSFLIQTRYFLKLINFSWHQSIRSISRIFIMAMIPICLTWLISLIWMPTKILEFIFFALLYSLINIGFYYYTNKDFQQILITIFNKYFKLIK